MQAFLVHEAPMVQFTAPNITYPCNTTVVAVGVQLNGTANVPASVSLIWDDSVAEVRVLP